MADRRKNNGGNSTVAKGADKRKNNFRKAINDAFSPDDVIGVLYSMQSKALKGDVQAARVFLENLIGKPKESLDLSGTVNGGIDFNTLLMRVKDDSAK